MDSITKRATLFILFIPRLFPTFAFVVCLISDHRPHVQNTESNIGLSELPRTSEDRAEGSTVQIVTVVSGGPRDTHMQGWAL